LNCRDRRCRTDEVVERRQLVAQHRLLLLLSILNEQTKHTKSYDKQPKSIRKCQQKKDLLGRHETHKVLLLEFDALALRIALLCTDRLVAARYEANCCSFVCLFCICRVNRTMEISKRKQRASCRKNNNNKTKQKRDTYAPPLMSCTCSGASPYSSSTNLKRSSSTSSNSSSYHCR
jgi:hypothetical protein